ncbi:methylated-DNA--[protein]-cysteine S-methyltransferase [Actinophytocola sp.]|uniref:methylated-DNA--[protein]-cysteine S-methyltransferase n=1 Tax=Actinophytocola sp. TaxID=1872138 RepID=UPI002D8049F8|nr:methylated-DNA--[protein]-cysteine S-methyltransferase [Actinophytocola sp.]HET9141571.1 methylated-DNA--[protein]-cysteine S-methyltransferase [Actinophytocola sp.]
MSQTVAFGSVPTELGAVLVAVTELGVAGTSFQDTPDDRDRAVTELGVTGTGFQDALDARYQMAARLGLPVVVDPARTEAAEAELAGYFAGTLHRFTLPLDWQSTSTARRTVLSTLHSTVPYGEVITYGELAERSGTGIPPRGIGAIMGSNHIPIIVPCHRVVAGSHLGGFSAPGGVHSKRHLLTLEGHLPPTLW